MAGSKIPDAPPGHLPGGVLRVHWIGTITHKSSQLLGTERDHQILSKGGLRGGTGGTRGGTEGAHEAVNHTAPLLRTTPWSEREVLISSSSVLLPLFSQRCVWGRGGAHSTSVLAYRTIPSQGQAALQQKKRRSFRLDPWLCLATEREGGGGDYATNSGGPTPT